MTETFKRLDVDRLLVTAQIIVCCGSGGVGKTTTAAALALRAAELGRRTVVLTIDPARRLAQSMGLTALDNTPRKVGGVDESAGGELHAMMLDMKRTFDEIVLAHSDADKAEAILANPFYVAMSSSFSGTQEYMAMEKLGQLKASGEWDLDRRGHPTHPLGAGLPGRTATDGDLPGRAAAAAARGTRQGRRAGVGTGPVCGRRSVHRRPVQGARSAAAARPRRFRRGAGDDVRRVPATGRAHVCPAAAAGHCLRRRRGARA